MCENKNLTMMQGKGKISCSTLPTVTGTVKRRSCKKDKSIKGHNVEPNLMQKETKMGKRMLERVSETSVH